MSWIVTWVMSSYIPIIKEFCLWLPMLWYCESFYNSEFSAINLGSFLAVLWVFFAWYQLVKPRHKIRFKFRGVRIRFADGLLLISIIFSLTSSIIHLTPFKNNPWIGFNLFREILAAISVIFCGIIYLVIANIPIKKVKDIDKFLGIVVSYLWKWQESINAIGQEMRYFIESVVTLADTGNNEALSALRVLLDKSLIDYIVNDNLFTLDKILSIYTSRKKVGESYIDMIQEEFISTIIESSLNYENSLIAKELRWDLFWWINQGKWIVSQRIFDDFEFIDQYDLLIKKRFPLSHRDNQDQSWAYAYNFVKFRDLAIKSFFEKDRNRNDIEKNIKFHKSLYKGITSFCWYKWILMNNYEDFKITHYVLESIGSGIFNNADQIMKFYWNSIPTFSIDSSERFYSKLQDPSNFFESIAMWLYNIMETISYIEENERNSFKIRDIILWFFNDATFFWGSDKEGKDQSDEDRDIWKVFMAIKNIFNQLLEKQILENNIKGYYPMMTRTFFHIYWSNIFGKKLQNDEKDFCNRILKELGNALPQLHSGIFWWITEHDASIDGDIQEARTIKIQEILSTFFPYLMIYNKENNSLTYYYGGKLSKSTINLKTLDITTLG